MTKLEKARTRLRKLSINRVDLVDAGAAPGAHIMLMKRDEEQDFAADPAEDDVAKAKFNAADRKQLAASGDAMSDGSFPIRNESDLMNARQSLGRVDPSRRDAVVAHIKTRAKALGVTLPDDFGKSAAEIQGDVCDNGSVHTAPPTSTGDTVTETERVAELEKALEDAEAALEAAKEDAVAKADAAKTEIEKSLEEVRKQNVELAEEVRKANDERKLAVSIEKAKASYGRLPVEATELGAVLKAASEKLTPEEVETLEKALAAGHEALSKAFVEKGSGSDNGGVGNSYEQIESLAKARATENKISVAKAMTEVLETEEGRALYAEYLKNGK